jgi:hypothetical protein
MANKEIDFPAAAIRAGDSAGLFQTSVSDLRFIARESLKARIADLIDDLTTPPAHLQTPPTLRRNIA